MRPRAPVPTKAAASVSVIGKESSAHGSENKNDNWRVDSRGSRGDIRVRSRAIVDAYFDREEGHPTLSGHCFRHKRFPSS